MADEDCDASRRHEGWDDDHPVPHHFWAASGPSGRRTFIDQVEMASTYVLACQKPAVLARVFGPSSDEVTATGR